MDQLDKFILFELSSNCRVSFSDLAKKANVTPNTIKNRVSNLEKSRIILQYQMEINPRVFNLNNVLISFIITNQQICDVKEKIGSNSLVYGVGITLNQGIATAYFRSNDELAALVDFLESLDLAQLEVFPILLPTSTSLLKPQIEANELQPIDWLLLYHLRANARVPLSHLASRTKISVKTIRKRINSLLRKSFIRLTIQMNPGATQKGIMVVFKCDFEKLTQKMILEIEGTLKAVLGEQFWVSWRVVGRPLLLLACKSENINQIEELRIKIMEVIPKGIITGYRLGGEINYYPDLIDDFLEKKRTENWFSPEQWRK